ncbi:MAG: hypothetical protein H6728_06910 [Myxococcales bacterium]|nr:hypothetical protein [Myxococcales bacterium]
MRRPWFRSFCCALALSALMVGQSFYGCVPPTSNESTAETTKEPISDKTVESIAEVTPEPTQEAVVQPDGSAEATPEATPEPVAETSPEPNPTETTPENSSKVVYYGQAQTILQQKCQVCHTTGGIAPFPLTTYEESKGKASLIKWSVENRRMPPWMPSTRKDCPEFDHAIALTDEQIKTLTLWVDGGTLEGDPAKATQYTPKQDTLSHVDVEVGAQSPHTPSGKNPDDYHCFLTEMAVPQTGSAKELTGFQFLPGVKEMVHHVLIYRVNSSYAQTLGQQHPTKEWSCTTGALFNQSGLTQGGLIGVWVPGTDVVHFPQDTGMPMQAGDHLVLELHYNLSNLPTPKADQSRIRLEFAKTPVKVQLQLTLQADFSLNIPAQSKGHEEKNTFTTPANVRVWGLMPHMHKFGAKFRTDLLKNGQNSCFIDIPRWDYNWQQTFFFKTPIQLAAGDKLNLTCTYDNPTDQSIHWGDKTGDEMCLNFYFYSVP